MSGHTHFPAVEARVVFELGISEHDPVIAYFR